MADAVSWRRALRWRSWVEGVMRPVDAHWLAAFRIAFGCLLAISMGRFLAYGWVDRLFVSPKFHFKYWGFAWVDALPGSWMHALFVVLLGLCVCVAVGFMFRGAALLLALGLSYVQLIDVSTYLNHYYLAGLLAWLLALSPAGKLWSVDRRRARGPAALPSAETIPGGWLYLFRFQVGIVYVFAGLAKAQTDWLVHGQPLSIWLGANTDLPILGRLFTVEGVPLLISWCGFLFDTSVVFALLSRRLRPLAFCVLVMFHAVTRLLLPIGMFPFIMVSAALVFFEPDWPKRLAVRFGLLGGAAQPQRRREERPRPTSLAWRARVGVALGVCYCAVQLLMPLRYLAYGGNVLWHEQGMRFSWRVMVRAKGGSTTFTATHPETGRVWQINPRQYLNELQMAEMSSQPDLILQLAHHIEQDLRHQGYDGVEIRADARVAFNGRRAVPLVDPTRDLTQVNDGFLPQDWILAAPATPPPRTKPVL